MEGEAAIPTNPVSDFIRFATTPQWPTWVFWLLVALSLVIAARALATSPEQRSAVPVVRWAARVLVGGMWWQQTLWKIPPSFGALRYWTEQMAQHAAFAVQRSLVADVVLPYFVPFAVATYLLEAAVAVSLILGLFVPLAALAGGLLIVNLWLGLYNAPHEWPWTYFFLILLMLLFGVERYGRSLGADALIRQRRGQHTGRSFLLAFT